jgi:enamine deaminase RidA (YjgF/YER057c/UK114 family)
VKNPQRAILAPRLARAAAFAATLAGRPTQEDPMALKQHIVSDKLHSRIFNGKSIFPHAVTVEGKRMIFVSGQLAWDQDGNCVGKGDMRVQFRQVCENIAQALRESGASWSDVVQTNTYVTDMDAFFTCTDIRHEYFGAGWPTSTTVEVRRLAHPDMLVEVEAVAVVG